MNNDHTLHSIYPFSLSDITFHSLISLSFSDAEQSFRKAKWLPQARVLQLKPQLLRNFIQRRHDGSNDEFGDLVNGIHPDSLLVERVIAQKSTLHGQLYLTKWRGLAYSEATWETENDLKDDKVGCWWYCYSSHGLTMFVEGIFLCISCLLCCLLLVTEAMHMRMHEWLS